MGLVGRQFSNPRGLAGRIVGRAMARGNAGFNRWAIDTVAARVKLDRAARIVDLGCGPGAGLEKLLQVFPDAQVCGIDRSPVMIAQSCVATEALSKADA
jgi:trans-aconitate methyltransferase